MNTQAACALLALASGLPAATVELPAATEIQVRLATKLARPDREIDAIVTATHRPFFHAAALPS